MTIGPTTSGSTLRPTFGRGLGDLAASAITRIDSNPLNQLMTLDVGGMVLPRTGLEYKERGMDMGRETLIREGAGTLSTVFLVGWVGSLAYAVSRLLSPVFSINKTGVHPGSWINVKAMDVFADLLEKKITDSPSASVAEIRENFIRTTLAGLRATDHVQGRRISHDVLGEMGNKNVAKAMQAKISEKLLSGHLSEEALETLLKMYERKESFSEGTYKVFEMAMRWKNSQRSYKPLQEEAERLIAKTPEWHILPKKHAMDLAFEQLLKPKLNQELSRLSEKVQTASLKHVKELVKIATEGGLTGSVDMVDKAGNVLLKDRDLSIILREIKYFLEQYMDRALSSPKTGKLMETLTEASKEKVLSVQNDLIKGARKTKFWLTIVPFFAAIGLASIVAPINNWLTKRKYVGKVFFPGEGGPPKGMGDQVFRTIRGGAHPVRGRNNGVFQLFEQERYGLRSAITTGFSGVSTDALTGAFKGGGRW